MPDNNRFWRDDVRVPAARGQQLGANWLGFFGSCAVAMALVFLIGILFVWTQCRIQPDNDEVGVLLQKDGEELPNELIVAPNNQYQGIHLSVLEPGRRQFFNPWYLYWDSPQKALNVPPLKVAVLLRRFGKPLPEGQILALKPDEKGIVEEVKQTGFDFTINPIAYNWEIYDLVKIEPGFLGVPTLLVGDDPKDPNEFLPEKGARGVQPLTIQPGTYPEYSNPYKWMVTPIDVRSQRFEAELGFPSKDGFDIKVVCIVEWAPDPAKLPLTFVKFFDETDPTHSGGIHNMESMIILPFARSLFRNVGGEHDAVDYITGDTRLKVQAGVEQRMKDDATKEGLIIKSFLIKATDPPERIQVQYGRREVARREIDRIRSEIETEIGKPVIEGGKQKVDSKGKPVFDDDGTPVIEGGKVKTTPDGKAIREGGQLAKIIQERMKDRQTKLGEVRSQVAVALREAEKYNNVELKRAEKELGVAKLHLAAAEDQASQITAKGRAEAEVIAFKINADVEGVKVNVGAFSSGQAYAEWLFIKKYAPAVRRILSGTEGPFVKLFERFAEPQQPAQTQVPR